MTRAKRLQMLLIRRVNIKQICSQFGKNFINLELLSLTNINVDIIDNITNWSNMNKMKWFNITHGDFEFNQESAQFLCQWKHIEMIGFQAFGAVDLPGIYIVTMSLYVSLCV